MSLLHIDRKTKQKKIRAHLTNTCVLIGRTTTIITALNSLENISKLIEIFKKTGDFRLYWNYQFVYWSPSNLLVLWADKQGCSLSDFLWGKKRRKKKRDKRINKEKNEDRVTRSVLDGKELFVRSLNRRRQNDDDNLWWITVSMRRQSKFSVFAANETRSHLRVDREVPLVIYWK